jgi:N-acetylglutamate synthase-like GNAT family acetyltransferase
MSTREKQGLVRELTPTDVEMAEVEQLIEICNKYEGLRMRLDTEPMRKRPGDNAYDFLYYEDGKLVGCLALDSFGRKQKEVTGMVHPEYRRRGIFRTLLEAVKEESIDMGVQKLILVCEENSLQEANASDFDTIVSIMATDLDEGESIEGLEQWVAKVLQDPNRHIYLGRFGGDSVSCGEPIGCLR